MLPFRSACTSPSLAYVLTHRYPHKPTNARTHTAAQRWRCFRSYDISPSPSSIWVRTWKSGAARPLFLSTESTSHCSVWGLWCCCGAFTHLEPVPPVREPISGSVRPTLPLESQQERMRGRRKGGVYDRGNEQRRDAGDQQKVERRWCYTNTGEDWTSWFSCWNLRRSNIFMYLSKWCNTNTSDGGLLQSFWLPCSRGQLVEFF